MLMEIHLSVGLVAREGIFILRDRNNSELCFYFRSIVRTTR